MDIQENLAFILETIKPLLSKDTQFITKEYGSLEAAIRYSTNSSTKILQLTFTFSKDGLRPSVLAPLISIHRLEKFIKPIVLANQLPYSDEFEFSVAHATTNRQLYLDSTLEDHDDKTLKPLIRKVLEADIIPFFNKVDRVEDLREILASASSKGLTKSGIGGQYPVKFLKAITIAKWCNLESRYAEYKNWFLEIVNDERNDPDTEEEADSFQHAFDELIAKLEDTRT